MTPPLAKRLANLAARSARRIRRTLLPGVPVGRIPFASTYFRWAERAARLDYVDDVVGHRMYLDDCDSLRLSVARIFEPVTTRFVRATLGPGQRALDVGANIGYFTLLFAGQVGPAGRVYAFEPDATNFSLLARNVEANGYRNVTAVNRAVWDRSGPLQLFLSEDNRGDHHVYDMADGRRSVTIQALRLDDYFPEPSVGFDLVKMDIQGAEQHALEGMRGLIGRSPGLTFIIEFWPAGLRACGSSGEQLLDTLAGLGFQFQVIDDRVETLVHMSREQLLESCTPQNAASVDLVCRRP